MAAKSTSFLCVMLAMVAIEAKVVPVAPVAPAAPILARIENLDAAPQYSFAYDVQDPSTGDSKAQFETRNGDIVQGSYSLIEADGTRRIVDYTSDPVNGFNAVVNREPAVAVASVVEPALKVAAPVAGRVVASPVAVTAERVLAPSVSQRVVAAPVTAVGAVPVTAGRVVSAPVAAVESVPALGAVPVPAGRVVSAPIATAPVSYAAAAYTSPIAVPAAAAYTSPVAVPAAAAYATSPFAVSSARVVAAPVGPVTYPSARFVAAPVAAAPVTYTLPRAVATRLTVPVSAPFAYPAAYTV